MSVNFMNRAIVQAENSGADIPVGAVITYDGKIIAEACNEKEKNIDISAHAEIIALKKASKILGNWRLDKCDMYVTLEPCPMCGWAILQSRIRNLYFGCSDNLYGTFSNTNLLQISGSKTKVYAGIMEDECNKLINHYFMNIRNK